MSTDTPASKPTRARPPFFRRKKVLWSLALGSCALAVGGYFVARKVIWPKYKAHLIEEMNAEAADLLARKDPVNAMLLIRKSLQRSQANAEAWRLGAEASAARNQAEALFYQSQLCKMEPSAENNLRLMQLAKQFEQTNLLIGTGKDSAKELAHSAEYHKLMAEAYEKVGRPIAAKFHLEILCSLMPGDLQAKLNLAALRLKEDSKREDKTLRAQLRELAEVPSLKREALALLLREAVDNRLRVDAQELMSRLEILHELDTEDQLLLIEAASLARPSAALDKMRALLAEQVEKPENLARVIDRLRELGQAKLILEWHKTLGSKTPKDLRVRRALADAMLAESDWGPMLELLQDGRWEDKEYLRHALLARVYKEKGQITEYFENWKASTMEAGPEAKACMDLLNRVEAWGWGPERFDVVWKLFHLFPNNTQLRNQLYAWELRNKNTPNLNRMFSRMLEIDPGEPVARSNFAYSSFLLKANLGRAGLIAQQLHKNDPNNPFHVTLYAYHLLEEGKTEEALAQMESLRLSAMNTPERQALYANILAKAGQFEKATEVISGINSASILPEERSLVEEARETIAKGTRTRELVDRVNAMRQNGAAGEGGWLALMQPETRANTNPGMQLANSLYQAGEYANLAEVLSDDNWNDQDYLRHALRSLSLQKLGDRVRSGESWRSALDSARRRQTPLENLAALTAQWTWDNERLQVLNALFEVTPGNKLLLTELMETYRARGRTPEMIRLLTTHLGAQQTPGHEAVALAYYSLISGTNTTQATVLAKTCMDAEPDDTDVRYTQALSLLKLKRSEEAVQLVAGTRGVVSTLVCIPLIQAMVLESEGKHDEAGDKLRSLDQRNLLLEEVLQVEKLERSIKEAKAAKPRS